MQTGLLGDANDDADAPTVAWGIGMRMEMAHGMGLRQGKALGWRDAMAGSKGKAVAQATYAA